MRDHAGLDAALPALRCPNCAGPLTREVGQVRCASGHSFDVARQGYVNLAVGARAATADSTGMVEARERFLGRGHYRPVADAICSAVGGAATVVDLAGGTGYYLARVLDATGGRGLCVDLSLPALRRAARSHPRTAAVGADAWQRLPLVDGVADAVLTVFGPRDPSEIERVLTLGGVLVLVAPEPGHLKELVEPMSLVAVDPRKSDRAAAAFARFDEVARQELRYPVGLTRQDAYAVAAMGPSARHTSDAELRSRAASLPEPFDVTVDVTITTYRPRGPESR